MSFLPKHWKFFVKIVISIILFWLVANNYGGRKTLNLLHTADLGLIALSCAFLIAAFISNGVRWRIVSRAIGYEISAHTMFVGTAEAAFFNQILPTGIGGDAMRVLRVFNQGIPLGWAVIGVTIDRALGLLAVAISLLGLVILKPAFLHGGAIMQVLLIASLIVCSGAFIAILIGTLPLKEFVPKWGQGVAALFDVYARIMQKPIFLAAIAIAMVGTIAFYTTSFILCARSVGNATPWFSLFVVVQGIALAALIPFSIGGWGVREGAAILLFAPLSVSADQALAVSVVFGLVLTLTAIFGGVVWLVSRYRGVDTLLPTNQKTPS